MRMKFTMANLCLHSKSVCGQAPRTWPPFAVLVGPAPGSCGTACERSPSQCSASACPAGYYGVACASPCPGLTPANVSCSGHGTCGEARATIDPAKANATAYAVLASWIL